MLLVMSSTGKIGIIITGDPIASITSTRGDYAQIIASTVGDEWDGDYVSWDARGDLPVPCPTVAGIIITGSTANVPDRKPWMLKTESWLRDRIGEGIPTLGICFGHQILAQALGGEVQMNPQGREMSTVDVTITSNGPLFDGLGSSFPVNACHIDSVVRLPRGARSLAHSDGDDHQAIQFAPRCYGVQFHPEFDGAIMRAYVFARSEPLIAEGHDPVRLCEQASDTPQSASVLRHFVQRVVKAD